MIGGNKDLINKYRPQTFDELFGHEEISRSLRNVLDKGTSRSFLFVGPSGCGKTTLARLVGIYANVPLKNLLEFDAATHSGAESVRSLTEGIKYKAFGKNPNKLIIVDECHSLSKQAWQALLKSIEEPPEHVYWCLCTTEVGKVPQTIKTRCVRYDVDPLSDDDIRDLISEVADQEKISVETSILNLITTNASGSPRQALVDLGKCASATTRDEAVQLIKSVESTNETVDLCRALVKMDRFEWDKLVKILPDLKGQNPENIRVVINDYITKCLEKEKRPSRIIHYLKILEAFAEPFNERDKLAPVYLALGNLCFGGD